MNTAAISKQWEIFHKTTNGPIFHSKASSPPAIWKWRHTTYVVNVQSWRCHYTADFWFRVANLSPETRCWCWTSGPWRVPGSGRYWTPRTYSGSHCSPQTHLSKHKNRNIKSPFKRTRWRRSYVIAFQQLIILQFSIFFMTVEIFFHNFVLRPLR